MSLKFSATSLNECLEKASSELNISKEILKYRVTKEERKFFKKRVEIEIIDNQDVENEMICTEDESAADLEEEKEESFGAKVEDGKIIVKDSKNEKDVITIKSCTGVNLFVNGNLVDKEIVVSSNDTIEYKFDEIIPIRNAEITITSDKMEAYINIRCNSSQTYKLVDKDYSKKLVIEKKKVGNKYPEKYTVNELKGLIQSKGIRYGIINEVIESVCNEYNVDNKLIAKGVPVVNDIPDEIKVLFKESGEVKEFEENNNSVDYRNRFLISNAKIGQVIGTVIAATPGNDGQDIFGVPLKRKISKKVSVRIGEGCKLEDNNIIATIEGKPDFKSNTFTVNKLYKVDQVDLKSGNINFVGNVQVTGTVCESMEVKAGNELFVGKNVESAKIRASGEITIKGNVIHSIVTSSCESVERSQYIENLMNLRNMAMDLIASTKQVQDNKLLGQRSDGEIIKILIENKYKTVPNIARGVLNFNMSQGVQHSEVTTFIINKLLGLGPLKIQNYRELDDFKIILDEEIDEMEQFSVTPTDVYLGYAQSSHIEAAGSVYITGKGQYISNITALKNIVFTNEKSACRGGVLSAESEIRVRTVGSDAGVNTILKVSRKGHIFADVAYYNTIFAFGDKQIMLETSSKKVEAYLDKDGEIVMNKLVL